MTRKHTNLTFGGYLDEEPPPIGERMHKISFTFIRRTASGRRREVVFDTETEAITLDQARKLLEFEQFINSLSANLRLHISYDGDLDRK